LDVAVFGPQSQRNRFERAASFEEMESVPRGPRAIPAIPQLSAKHRKKLNGRRIELVISDGDPASLLAARLQGIPSIAVGHNVIFTRAELPPSVPTSALLYERANAWLSTKPATAAVAANFLPLTPNDPNTRIARPDLRWNSWPSVVDEGFYLAYFRDGEDGGLVEELARQGRRVRVYGNFDGILPESAEKRPFDNKGFLADLSRCRAVVATGGSNLIAEALYLEKPLFGIFKTWDMEQRINVALLKERNLGDGCHIDEVSAEHVAGFVRCVEDGRFGTVNIRETMPTVSDAVVDTVRSLTQL
jgi:uncharacterized protein (TIGR00661 family)